MTRAEDHREELEALVRQKIGGAYRYGLVSMSMQASSPLGYPEENEATDAILAAADAYAEACVKVSRRAPRKADGPPKPPAVHYDDGEGAAFCVPGDHFLGKHWAKTSSRRDVTCRRCLKALARLEAAR